MHFSYGFRFFFFNDTATTEIYTLSLHDALPIWGAQHREQVVGDRQHAPRAAPMVEALVHYQPVDPGSEGRVAAKLADGGEQLDEDVLRDIHGQRFVAGEAEGDRVDTVFEGLEQGAEGVALAAPGGVDQLPLISLCQDGHVTLRRLWNGNSSRNSRATVYLMRNGSRHSLEAHAAEQVLHPRIAAEALRSEEHT